MQFARMGRSARQSHAVVGFSGGLNTQDPPLCLDEHTLPDCLNVYWRRGVLGTRPALRFGHRTDAEDGGVVSRFETADGEYLFLATEETLLVYYREALVLKAELRELWDTELHTLFAESGRNSVLLLLTETRDGAVLRRTPYEILLDREHTQLKSVLDDYYVPLVFVNGRGSTERHTHGHVTMYEGFNMLTNAYRAQWTTDGEAVCFCPPFGTGGGVFRARYTHTDGKVYTFSVHVEDTAADVVSVSEEQEIPSVGKVYLQVWCRNGACAFMNATTKAAVALPDVGFSGNLEVQGTRAGSDGLDVIYGMSFSEWYGGQRAGLDGGAHLFLSGNPNEPHTVRYSDVNNPLYFPENNVMQVGDRTQAVTAFGKQNGQLVIFKEREIYACEYAYQAVSEEALAAGETVDVTTSVFFPLTMLHSAVGCDLPRTVRLCGNRLVWASRDGAVYMLSALNAWSEKAVRCVSYAVAPTLREVLGDTACAVLYHGNYLLFCGREVLLFDYMGGGFAGFAAQSDDKKASRHVTWFRWRLPFAAACVLGQDDAVTVVMADGAVLQTACFGEGHCDGDGLPIESRIVTKPFSLGSPSRQKSVYGLWLQLENTGAAVAVSLHDGGGELTLPYTLQTACDTEGSFSPYAVPCRQTRVQAMGVTVTSTEPLALAGLHMEFCSLGVIR